MLQNYSLILPPWFQNSYLVAAFYILSSLVCSSAQLLWKELLLGPDFVWRFMSVSPNWGQLNTKFIWQYGSIWKTGSHVIYISKDICIHVHWNIWPHYSLNSPYWESIQGGQYPCPKFLCILFISNEAFIYYQHWMPLNYFKTHLKLRQGFKEICGFNFNLGNNAYLQIWNVFALKPHQGLSFDIFSIVGCIFTVSVCRLYFEKMQLCAMSRRNLTSITVSFGPLPLSPHK